MNAMLRLLVYLTFAANLTSCESVGGNSCMFQLERSEWEQVPKNSDDRIVPLEIGDADWYKSRETGDYIVCHNPKRDYLCGSIYETFSLRRDGGYDKQDYVCIE